MLYEEFKDRWNSMDSTPNGFLTLDINHPLDLHIGHYNSQFKSLIIMDTGRIESIPSSFAVSAVNSELKNGKWILEFRLIHESYEEEYLRLCWDMIDYSSTSSAPLKAFIHKYLTWQRLLQYANKNVLSFERQKGLLGELLCLKECMDVFGAETGVNAWQGPDGSDQDFQYDNTWIEVKTTALASENVKISSLQQLEQEQDGELRVYVLEKSAEGKERYNLVNVVNTIRQDLAHSYQILDHFEMKLFKYGYRKAHEEFYYEHFFRLVDTMKYCVDEKFPKLIRSNVDVAVTACKYELSLSAIDKFRRP